MKGIYLKGLDPSTQVLLTELMSTPDRARWWGGHGDTISILEQIQATNEPAAIPGLMPFGLSSSSTIRTRARAIIRHLFAQIPLDSLPLLDELLRRSWSHVENWYGLKPSDVRRLGLEKGGADQLFLALVSCHRSGYVRAEALRVLGAVSSEWTIPFVLIRLVDWVSEVQSAAEEEFNKVLAPGNADIFVNSFALIDRLSKNSRFRSDFMSLTGYLLKSPECADALQRGMMSSHHLVRRHSYEIAVGNAALIASDVVDKAVRDHDVKIRRWAYVTSLGFQPAERNVFMTQAASDPYGPIRQIAYRWLAAQENLQPQALFPFLLDRSVAIRRECQSAYIDRYGESPADLYRAAMLSSIPRKAEVGVFGLAETGSRDDGTAISEMLAHESAKVRSASVRALRMLGVPGQESLLLRLISSDVRSVAREAAITLLSHLHLQASVVWKSALENSDERVLISVLRLLGGSGKWKQLSLYLEAVGSDKPTVSDCAIEVLATWLKRFNSSFIEPSTSERASLVQSFNIARSRLPGPLARELSFILQPTH